MAIPFFFLQSSGMLSSLTKPSSVDLASDHSKDSLNTDIEKDSASIQSCKTSCIYSSISEQNSNSLCSSNRQRECSNRSIFISFCREDADEEILGTAHEEMVYQTGDNLDRARLCSRIRSVDHIVLLCTPLPDGREMQRLMKREVLLTR
jgi:hypothetical protein